MKPDRREDKVAEQPDLVKIPRKTMAKNMRNIEELVDELKKDEPELTLDEERLLDRHVFTKTGKHIGRFKESNKPKPKDTIPSVSKQPGAVLAEGPIRDEEKLKKLVKVPGKVTVQPTENVS